jgi:predicted nucleic acid-binding protein
MIFVDTAYIVKCFVPELGHVPVRELFDVHKTVAASTLSRVEFAVALNRTVREGRLPHSAVPTAFQCLERDERDGMWEWHPVTTQILRSAEAAIRNLSPAVYLRAADAVHIICARENGFREIYSNDRHLLAAAPHFGLRGVNVIP